jgi:transposase
MKKHIYPDWVLSHRQPGTELRYINGHYYLYAVKAIYDPIAKKGKKKTGALLGKIHQGRGFIPSRKLAEPAVAMSSPLDLSQIHSREFGFSNFLAHYNQEIEKRLRTYFPAHYQLIIYMAYCRLVYHSPLQRMPLHIQKSMLSWGDSQAFYPQKLSQALSEIGLNRGACVQYMQSFKGAGESILVDLTHLFSASEGIAYAQEGYNSQGVFEKQINLMYIYSASIQQPLYYKLLAGNRREVNHFKLCLQESGLQDAIIIADKGFYSQENRQFLTENNLSYIMPLPRDNALIRYDGLDQRQNQYFVFEERIIWWTEYEVEGHKIKLFQDDRLKIQEQKDYLQRIDQQIEGYTRPKFNERLPRFGTFALLTNLPQASAEEVYIKYKSRNAIEVMFDGVKNILQADVMYMQKEETLNGWMFVNHIALQWYYIIYRLLAEKKLLAKYSVRQFITELAEHRKIKIQDEWVEEVMLKATQKMLKKLKLYSVN